MHEHNNTKKVHGTVAEFDDPDVLMAVRPPLEPPASGSGALRLLQAAWLWAPPTGGAAAATVLSSPLTDPQDTEVLP